MLRPIRFLGDGWQQGLGQSSFSAWGLLWPGAESTTKADRVGILVIGCCLVSQPARRQVEEMCSEKIPPAWRLHHSFHLEVVIPAEAGSASVEKRTGGGFG